MIWSYSEKVCIIVINVPVNQITNVFFPIIKYLPFITLHLVKENFCCIQCHCLSLTFLAIFFCASFSSCDFSVDNGGSGW